MKRLTPAVLTLMLFVVVGGLVAAYIAKGLFAVEKGQPVATTRLVPMAIHDLEPGTIITDRHIGQGPTDIASLTRDVLISERVIVGRAVKERIPAATAIRAGQLYQPGERPPLEVPDDMRAVAISVGPSVAMVDGLIRPGEYVDVHFTPSSSGSNDQRLFRGGLTLTLFKGVKVIAINQNYTQGSVDRSGNTLTLELTPEQANIIILAEQKGSLTTTFTPDGPGSGVVAVSSEDRATLDEILGLKPLPTPEPPFSAEIYRGGSREYIEFRNGKRYDYSRQGFGDPTGTSDFDDMEQDAGQGDDSLRTPNRDVEVSPTA